MGTHNNNFSNDELNGYWGALKTAMANNAMPTDLCLGGMACIEVLLEIEGKNPQLFITKFKRAYTLQVGLYEEVE